MTLPPKMGRLVVGGAQVAVPVATNSEPIRERREPNWLITGLLLGMAAAGIAALWFSGWLPAQFVPRKVLIRGCALTTAAADVALLGDLRGRSYLAWWQAGRKSGLGDGRWLRGMGVKPLPGRTVLLNVNERRPVLAVESAGARYWLCDDHTLVPAEASADKGQPFAAIMQLPRVQLAGLALDDVGNVVDQLLVTVATCNEVLPGQIRRISVNAASELTMFDSTGLEIRLGAPVDVTAKIAALPKALRAASADRANLNYLDASQPRIGDRLVIYENHKRASR